jgi:internalin A
LAFPYHRHLKSSSPQRPPEIITYYLKHYRAAAEKKPLNEAKALLLGQGAVGKTSLLKRLTTNTFDPHEGKTEGIDIHRWQMNVDRGEIYLNLWDFGGQEIMHATHQFFMTKRSLYLLVLNSRQSEQENRVEYWLRLIKSFGGESPVIVVCNRCDEHEMEMNWRGLSEKYANIKAIVRRVSCKSGEGLEELQRRMENEVSVLPHIHNELLSSWFAVKNELVAMSENFISFTRYQEICAAHDITEAEDQKTLLGFLHDLGIVLHFR